jgi:hypothetical protein
MLKEVSLLNSLQPKIDHLQDLAVVVIANFLEGTFGHQG